MARKATVTRKKNGKKRVTHHDSTGKQIAVQDDLSDDMALAAVLGLLGPESDDPSDDWGDDDFDDDDPLLAGSDDL